MFDTKLFTRYSAEQYWAIGVSHSDGGMLVLSHRDERFFGSGTTLFSDFLNLSPASASNLVWIGTPAVGKTTARMPSALNCLTNLITASILPETYTLDDRKIRSTIAIVESYFYTKRTYCNRIFAVV